MVRLSFSLFARYGFLIAFAAPWLAFGKGWSSTGGGTGVLCPTRSGLSLELLDLAEASERDKGRIYRIHAKRSVLLTPNDWMSIYKTVLRRVEGVHPRFGDALNKMSRHLFAQEWDIRNLAFENDLGYHLPHKESCERVQIVRRTTTYSDPGLFLRDLKTGAPPQVRIEYNSVYWDLLDPVQKAMLLLHENIYALEQSAGAVDSSKVRAWVRRLFLMDSLSPSEQQELNAQIDREFVWLSGAL